jgi:hypothetical protein
VLDEGDDVGALGQHQQPLLEAHQQGIDLAGLVVGLLRGDFANGKGM